MYYTTFSPKVSRAFHNFFYFKTNLGVFNNIAVIQLLFFCEIIIGRKTGKLDKNAKEKSFGSSLSRKACGEFEGRSPSITKAQSQNAQRTIRAQKTFDLKKRCGNNQKIERVQSLYHAQTMCGDIAAPEINGDSSLISRPVRGDTISQCLG
ncbi:MAG: hypothetical protein E7494_14810 [Ruminococcus albus]|nr:hypothetical protein [Ruminococcus albus]